MLPLALGTRALASFRVAKDGTARRVNAAVIRAESNEGELMLAFPFRIGLRFEHPLPDLPGELAEHVGVEIEA